MLARLWFWLFHRHTWKEDWGYVVDERGKQYGKYYYYVCTKCGEYRRG